MAGAFKARPELNPSGGGGGSGGGKSDAEQAQDRLDNYTESLKRQSDVLQAQIQTFGQSNAEVQKAVELAKAANDLSKLDATARQASIEKLNAATEASARYRETLDKLKEAQRNGQEQARFFGDSLVGALDSAIVKGNSLKDVLKNLSSSLASAALKSLLQGGAFFGNSGSNGNQGGLLGGLFGGASGGGGLGSIFGSLFKGFFADGGDIPRGGFGIAGENGPELIKGPATVFNKAQLGGGGGTTIKQNVSFDFSNSAGLDNVRAMVAQGMALATQQARAGALKDYSETNRRGVA